jgi:hypothetical protein
LHLEFSSLKHQNSPAIGPAHFGFGPPICQPRAASSPRSRFAPHVGLQLQKFHYQTLVSHGMAENFLVVRDRPEIAGEKRDRPLLTLASFHHPPDRDPLVPGLSPYINGPRGEDGREGSPEQWTVSCGLHDPGTRVRALESF